MRLWPVPFIHTSFFLGEYSRVLEQITWYSCSSLQLH
jgi:hypothetical protein